MAIGRRATKMTCVALLAVLLVACGGGGSGGGADSTTPAVQNHSPTISGQAPAATVGQTYVFTPVISDADGDHLTLTIANRPTWLQFNANNGALTGQPSSGDVGTFSDIIITVSDGKASASLTLSIVVERTALESALRSGDARAVDQHDLVMAINDSINNRRADFAAVRQVLFGLNADGSNNANSVGAIDWNPGRWSIYLSSASEMLKGYAVLPNNWNYGANTASTADAALALAGTDDTSGSRYIAFGGHPFATRGNSEMDKFVRNAVLWLTRHTDGSGLKVVVAQQPSGNESATRNWLANTFAGVVINGVSSNPASQSDNLCDNANLAGCLAGADLLVIDQDQGAGYNGSTIQQAVAAAMSRGVGVLYTHSTWSVNDLGTQLQARLGVYNSDSAGNFYTQYGVKSFTPADQPMLPSQLANIQSLIARLEDGSFTTNWSGCVSDIGKVSCNGDALYRSEFGTVTDLLRQAIRNLDKRSIAIFDSSDYTLEKLLVLLGDKYRASVAYSSTFKKENGTTPFLRALFSDVTSFMTRRYSTVALNLGNFSGLFPSDIQTGMHTVTVAPPASGSTEYATGLYVLPGRTVTLTRTDSGTGSVTFGVNILRDTSRPFNVMDRPTQLGSPRPALLANTPVTITNPYGGPLYVFVAAATGQPNVTVQVTNVITHPILRNPEDSAEVSTFSQELASTPTNWVVLATDMVTLHSNLPKFQESVAAYNGNIDALVDDTWTYFVKDTYELAGFNATSGAFSLPASVSSFCASKNWDCTGGQHRRDVMQHVVADEWAYCGGGCAGNPYDQNWAFAPLGWGETHEVGHNLQRGRLNIYGGISGEVSNNIFPVHKRSHRNQDVGQMVYADRSTIGNNQPTYCTDHSQSVASCLFTIMKVAKGTSDPTQTVYNAIWSDSAYAMNNSERVLFYRQLVEYANYYNASFNDGWELYTLLYLLERNFSNASSTWAADAGKFGFGTYTSYPSSISGNDFMLVATSYIIGKDMRPVFDLWGVTYSAAASNQVAAYGYAAAAQYMFPMKNLVVYGAGVGTPVVVSGSATYPAGF